MLHRAWLELQKLANRIHHRSRGNLLVVERARALPAMQPQQLLVSWDLLEELATAGLQHAVDFNHLWQLEQRWVSPTCWFNRDGSMFSDREPAGECPFVDQHEKRATEEEGKEAGRISLLDHIKLPTKSFLLQPDCNKSLYIIGKVLIYWL